MESRTQGSRPRLRKQKNSEAKAKDSPSEDRPSRGQGQKCSRPRPRTKDTSASVLQKKEKNFRRSPKKNGVQKFFFLLLDLCSKCFYVQAYADDLAVLVTGANMLWIRDMAQKAINIAANWASQQELQFSSKATKIVVFTHKRKPNLGSLSINGSKLELSKEARLLDLTLDSKLTWITHISQITRKGSIDRQIVGKTWEIKPSTMKWIYTAMISA